MKHKVAVADLPYKTVSSMIAKASNGAEIVDLLSEMAAAGSLELDNQGAKLTVHGWGVIGFRGETVNAAMRCYLAWKVGEEVDA